MLARILLTALGGLAGTGGGVAWQATRPPPSEIELQKLRADLDAEKSARAKDADECKEKIKETRSMDRDSYKDLRELMFEQVNKPLNQRVNSLEAWQADQVREQERDRRHIR